MACIYIGNSLVSWGSSLQKSVATSTSEAEYISLSGASKEGYWIKQLLDETTGARHSLVLKEDNRSAFEWSKNVVDHS
jgi:hypothetical protein